MPDIQISYDAYHELVIQLARRIEEAGKRPEQIIAVMRGGAIGGVILSHYWNVPLAMMAVKTRREDRQIHEDEDVYFSPTLLNNVPELGRNVLLFDDLADSGKTGQLIVPWLKEHHAQTFETITTATAFLKTCSVWRPDFFGQEIGPNEDGSYPWLVYPWETDGLVIAA